MPARSWGEEKKKKKKHGEAFSNFKGLHKHWLMVASPPVAHIWWWKAIVSRGQSVKGSFIKTSAELLPSIFLSLELLGKLLYCNGLLRLWSAKLNVRKQCRTFKSQGANQCVLLQMWKNSFQLVVSGWWIQKQPKSTSAHSFVCSSLQKPCPH